jgi:hypothetical protein
MDAKFHTIQISLNKMEGRTPSSKQVFSLATDLVICKMLINSTKLRTSEVFEGAYKHCINCSQNFFREEKSILQMSGKSSLFYWQDLVTAARFISLVSQKNLT